MPPRYMTPARYRTLGLGIDLSVKTDADIAALLDVATQLVNSYCAAPRKHDFRGGSVTNEPHEWNPGNVHVPGTYKVYPFHTPIREVTRLAIQLTNTQQLTFDQASQLFVQKTEGWVEPIAAANTTALFFAVPPFGLRNPVALIDYSYGDTYPVEDEVLVQTEGFVFAAANQFWVDDDVTVKIDGVETAAFTANITEGTITLDDLPVPGSIVTLDYSYTLPTNVARATGFITTDLLGFSNINASGLSGLSGIRVEEIELRQSSRVGFNVNAINPAARMLLEPFVFASFG